MFYLLSLITGVLECGWIAFGAVHSLPLWQILCYPLAYHIGNLFPKPFSLSKAALYCMTVFSALTSSLTFIKAIPDNAVFVLTCVSLFCISAVIQSVRSGLKSDGNRLLKRIFRVGGFALAPLAAIAPSIILIISSLIAIIALKGYCGTAGISTMSLQNGYSAVMIFHQLHYFFYAHITLSAISLMLVHNYSVKGTVFAALLFCGTWVTYMSVEPIMSKLTSKILPVFFAGHIGISILLCAMSFITNQTVFIILWLITGFGGGVVYTISSRAKAVNCYKKTSMTISENIGHTCGLLAAVTVAFLCGSASPDIMLIFGSASAMLAVISMTAIFRRENKNEFIAHKS